MKKGISYLLLCCFALSCSVFASTSRHHHKYHNHHHYGYKGEGRPVFTPEIMPNHFEVIGAGGVAALDAENSRLGVTSSEIDKLVQTNSDDWNTAAGQLGIGYIYNFCHASRCSDRVQWFPSIEPELNLYYLSSNSIDGDVWRFGSPGFNDLTFDMPLRSTRLMLDVALTVAAWRQYSIYAIGGLGNAWNRLGYSDRDKGNLPCPEQRLRLSSHTRSQFAWEVGGGLNFAFNDRIGLSLEYLFTHLGNVRTSGSGNAGILTTAIIPAHFNLSSQTGLLGLHIALG